MPSIDNLTTTTARNAKINEYFFKKKLMLVIQSKKTDYITQKLVKSKKSYCLS